jgi:hypothetical protein
VGYTANRYGVGYLCSNTVYNSQASEKKVRVMRDARGVAGKGTKKDAEDTEG